MGGVRRMTMAMQTTEPTSNNGAPPNAAPATPAAKPVDPKVEAANLAILSTTEGVEWMLVQRKANAYAKSSIVPAAYRGEAGVPNVIVAMEMAERIGCSPLMVMQNLDIIEGNPGFRSKFLIGTINTCGRFTPLRYEFEGERGKESWGCRAVATDKESKERLVGPLVSIEMARAYGWIDKKGSQWKVNPELMLTYRSATFWCRVYAPELSLGMDTAEEVNDKVHVTATEVPANLANDNATTLEAELLEESAKAKRDRGGLDREGRPINAATGEILDAETEKPL
jgi:hypothetical protein